MFLYKKVEVRFTPLEMVKKMREKREGLGYVKRKFAGISCIYHKNIISNNLLCLLFFWEKIKNSWYVGFAWLIYWFHVTYWLHFLLCLFWIKWTSQFNAGYRIIKNNFGEVFFLFISPANPAGPYHNPIYNPSGHS